MATQKRSTTSLSFEQIEKIAEGLPAQMDGFRADGLGRLGSVKRAKLVQSRRERGRLEAKHGAGHPLVVEADQRMTNEHSLLVNSRMERDRVNVTAVERQDGAWLLHGYVRTRDGLAISKATVALYPDADGNETALIETRSDSKGYFRLVLPRAVKKGESDAREAAAEEASQPGGGLEINRGGLNVNTNAEALDAQRTDTVETQPQRLANGIRINASIRDNFVKEPVYVGARPNGGELTMVKTPLYPAPSMIAYRDIVLPRTGQGGEACQLRTQFLGNSGTRELHNLTNEKPGCQIEEMRPDHRVYFANEAEARRLGYDLCAYCYGKAKSRR